MSRVLFTHSYFLRLDPKQWKQQQPYPPLATITAAAAVRETGREVHLHDTMFAEGAEELQNALEKHRPEYLVIYDDGFNYLTKMCLTNMREAAFRMIELAKAFGCRVIISSSDSTDHFEKYLDKGADYVILGEAEITLLELLDHLDKSGSLNEPIQGLVYRNNQETINTGRRAVMRDLDSLPIAAWDLVDIAPYQAAWKKHGYFSINIATTRGCPYKCNWCAKPIYGNRYNSRSPEHVVNELKLIRSLFHFDHIWFCDDIFGLKPGWVEIFAGLVAQGGFSFKFKIQSRADLLAKREMARHLAEAGCDTIWMGAESGSQKILDAMDKGISVEQIRQATANIREFGMKPAFFLQFGYLGEEKEDIEATLEMLFELMPDDIGVSVSYPLPGTGFYEKVKAELTQKANWADSDDLDLMFRNTYSPDYYKRLHRFIHKNFRKKQALQAAAKILSQPTSLDTYTAYKAASILYYIPTTAIEKMRLARIRN